ncbi:NADP-specific glutamate dehydrogenase [Candidatus Saccharibacteria bacterium]|nr:NADP-specific glutamate dehydrogenase [Candidatus Saccharibacteria bacterium]MCL1963043.1 NADP-specific glutamate dehydrogenase [Candidatus Saccharibacteria bacterium]
MFKTKYAKRVFEALEARLSHETEFLQAVHEVLLSVEPVLESDPKYEKNAILERMVDPDRQISFRVTWVDDAGQVQTNRGYRFEFNGAIGPYKGGLRFHPSVNPSIIKFLGFEQVFKNALTGLWLGGGKGGSDFDSRGKSDGEVMRFCQAFMNELYRHIGANTDVPAGDIGVGGREIGFLYGQYRKLTNEFTGVLTGKGLGYGGSLARTEATGYGLCYYTAEAMRQLSNDDFTDKTVVISGSGNVAIFAAEKAAELGGKVVAMSDSGGYVYDPDGIHLGLIKEIKLEKRGRILEYIKNRKNAQYVADKKVWEIPCDIALPCATQNDIGVDEAHKLIKNGVKVVAEGANMPTTPKAIDLFRESGVIFCPAKAANAGGVAVSGLEMAQNSMRVAWSFDEVDAKLQIIMKNIVEQSLTTAAKYNLGNDLAGGANISAFERVADAMIAQGVS